MQSTSGRLRNACTRSRAILASATAVLLLILTSTGHHEGYRITDLASGRGNAVDSKTTSFRFADAVIPCKDAYGHLVHEHWDDSVPIVHLGKDAPNPYAGSYEELHLEQTWTTADDRYGPYGKRGSSGDRQESGTWDSIDWAQLQNDCLLANVHASVPEASVSLLSPSRKLRSPTRRESGHWLFSDHVKPRPKTTTGRTAILLRGWSTFRYQPQDLWNIRSLITETALAYGGRYTVVLLVDVQDSDDVVRNSTKQDTVMASIPPELRNMTVFFDQEGLLKSWYPRIEKHGPELQMEQARQLFAYQFPEFDHIWQIELDIRFTGHSGNILNALDSFAREEPRKQARERSSFFFIPGVYDAYQDLLHAVNQTLAGGSAFWQGIRTPGVGYIGPEPPVERPEDDDFKWGVGEDADLILLSSTMNVTLDDAWVYKSWIGGFRDRWPPRLSSAPAVSRVSWNLATQIHDAQVWDGKYLQSEATPVSFAHWLGLKISRPPLPTYGQHADDYSAKDLDIFLNGGPPSSELDGMALGQNTYEPKYAQDVSVEQLQPSWKWNPGYAGHLFRTWLQENYGDSGQLEGDHYPREPLLQIRDGKVLMPNLMIHPVKTNPGGPHHPPDG